MQGSKRQNNRLARLWLRFNHPFSVVLIVGRNSRALHFSFRPFVTLVVAALLAAVIVLGLVAYARLQSQSWQVNNSLQQVQFREQESLRLRAEIEGLGPLLRELQTLLVDFEETSSQNQDPTQSDIVSQRSYSGLALFNNETNSDQRLTSVRQRLEQSLAPLRNAVALLQSQQNILVDLPTAWPVGSADDLMLPGGHISFFFGPQLDPITRRIYYLHRGLDIANYPPGLPIKAAANGRVMEAGYERSGYGNFVVLRHAYGYSTRYAHMLRTIVKVGQLVRQGEVIGYMGSTGRSTGSHLHFEIRSGAQLVDPLLYLHMSTANSTIIDSTLKAWEGRPFRPDLGKDGIY